jgi:tRNA(Ile)-lysidine synthase
LGQKFAVFLFLALFVLNTAHFKVYLHLKMLDLLSTQNNQKQALIYLLPFTLYYMLMLDSFLAFIKQQNLLQKNDRVLVAVSGGVDSVVLCELLHRAGFEIGIAHCNFGLRDTESDGDEAFVIQLAIEHYQCPFYTIKFDTQAVAAQMQVSIQMAARQLRYDWLENLRQTNEYKFLATAHHQNDFAETMLYNLSKGTGIGGLHGILAKKNKLIRPLLFTNKQHIEQFALDNDLSYRHDSSNDQTKYARNKIRHLVMPVLKEINPNLEQTFYENAQRFADVETIYRQGIAAYKKQLLKTDRHETRIAISQLLNLPALPTILYELLQDYGFGNDRIGDIIRALDAESGRVFLSATHQLVKDRKHLIISALASNEASVYLINPTDTQVATQHFTLSLQRISIDENFVPPTKAHIACLDTADLVYPLSLRRWSEGDYFYPLGMNRKKKKVSRYLIDQKLSRNEKDRTWLLSTADERTLWVVNHRLDERFKVTPKTKEVLWITFSE